MTYSEIYLKSPNGSVYALTVADNGTLKAEAYIVNKEEIEFE